MKDYIKINRALWNERTKEHVHSDFYDNKSFIEGRSSLHSIELDLLGNIRNKSVLHLQCHFGQDTISLQRLGATSIGVDLSDESIKEANRLAEACVSDSRFICCDLYDLPLYLDETFDVIFSSYGTIGWLPDLDRWASLIHRYLKPGGAFVFVEFHPFVWMYDDAFNEIQYSYFNKGPIEITEEGTYANPQADLSSASVSWNHPLSDVLGNLLKHDLSIETFQEFEYSPYNCFQGMEMIEEGKYIISKWGDKVPLVYGLRARKKL